MPANSKKKSSSRKGRKSSPVKVRWDLNKGKWGVLDTDQRAFVRHFDRGIMTNVIFDSEYTRDVSGCGGTYSGIAVGRLSVHGKTPKGKKETVKFDRYNQLFEIPSTGSRVDRAKALVLRAERSNSEIVR